MQRLDGSGIVVFQGCVTQLAQLCNVFLRLDIDLPAYEDQFVLGLLQAFLIHQEFFP